MTLDPGIHFGVSDEDYHAHPALSNSGIKKLLVSPLDFWAETAWLNPDYEPKETVYMDLGKAYECRIIEGKHAFEQRFTAELSPADYPKHIRTADQMKEILKGFGMKTTGTKAELRKRLENYPKFEGKFWDDLRARWEKQHAGKTVLPKDSFKRIEFATKMIESHPDAAKCFTGGYHHVSIIWTDEETGVPMKCQMDYLKPRAIIDLKTFGNQNRMPIHRAIMNSMARERYYVQAAVYQNALDTALENDLPIHGEVEEYWLKTLKSHTPEERQFVFVFQQTGAAPVVVPRILARDGAFDTGMMVVRQAQELYAKCLKQFGGEPWALPMEIEYFDIQEFPAWAWD